MGDLLTFTYLNQKKESVFYWLSIVFGNVKTELKGYSYHSVSTKHVIRYLDEF